MKKFSGFKQQDQRLDALSYATSPNKKKGGDNGSIAVIRPKKDKK